MPNKKKITLEDLAEDANLNRKTFDKANADTDLPNTPGSVIKAGNKKTTKKEKIKNNSKFVEKNAKKKKN